MLKVFPISLGCPKNLTDLEVMLGILQEKGYEVVLEEGQADIIILNTCAFIKPAISESEEELRKCLQLKAAGKIKKVFVTGCLVEREKEVIAKKYPAVDGFIGLGSLDRIGEAIAKDNSFIGAKPGKFLDSGSKFLATLPHFAYLKIADGCDNRCSYCTIPQIRGAYRSRPINDIILEAKELAKKGVKELVLIAQDTTSYGIDLYRENRLVELLKSLTKISGIEWIRLMYTYPEKITGELLKFMAQERKICRYLDLPLQHISSPILKSMGRQSTEESIRKKISQIREAVPEIALRTTFIVGYPGETAQDFVKLKRFVKEVRFNKVGVFTYWPEQGTPAADMLGQVKDQIKKKRETELIKVQSKVVDQMNKKSIGKVLRVLLDGPNFGRSEYDAPEIDGGITLDTAPGLKAGDFVSARIISGLGYQLKGALVT